MSKITIDRSVLEQWIEALDGSVALTLKKIEVRYEALATMREALAQQELQTCNCRWNGEVQVQQCTLHEAHVDAVHEWAERAKTAEAKLIALAQPQQEPVARIAELEETVLRLNRALREATEAPTFMGEPVSAEPAASIKGVD